MVLDGHLHRRSQPQRVCGILVPSLNIKPELYHFIMLYSSIKRHLPVGQLESAKEVNVLATWPTEVLLNWSSNFFPHPCTGGGGGS